MDRILIIGNRGYVGSLLHNYLNKNYDVYGVDTCWFDDINDNNTYVIDYNNLTTEYLSQFDVIILLAAHSSVKMSDGDPKNSLNNNVINFINLCHKLDKISKDKRVKFIYASSSSVYGDVGESIVDESYTDFSPRNNYDITKHITDLYIKNFDIEYYSLRFGTVNGYSPIMRTDIMINSMVSSAIENGYIDLYIKHVSRPILGMGDLFRCLVKILECNEDNRGIYNISSFNMKVEDIANEVSNLMNVDLHEIMVSQDIIDKCYNFSISSNKFTSVFGYEFKDNINSIVNSITSNYNNIKKTKRDKIFNYGM